MFKYTVDTIKNVSPSTVLLTLRSADDKTFVFQPGQYAAIQFTNGGRPSAARCFSIVSSPNDRNKLQFAFKVTGNYSYRLSQLRTDDTVYVQGPFGEFVIDPQHDRELVFLAAGIGVTPFVSMVRALSTQTNMPRTTLLYANRSAADIPFGHELTDLSAQLPNFRMLLLAEGDSSDLATQPGRINEQLLSKINSVDATYFVCGPPKFMDTMEHMLLDMGISPDRIVLEAFGQRAWASTRHHQLFNPRPVYATVGLALFLLTGGFVAKNLVEASQAHASTTTSTTESTANDTTTTDDTATDTTDDTSTDNSTDTTTNSSSSSTSNSNNYTDYQYQSDYQQPVSGVS
ncbi:hypothetical protein KDA23_00350 [Candidatus Saccharibacteria bacterium]|nr:hypothetical protein [Candidatus Saccharibacteria bacterium]